MKILSKQQVLKLHEMLIAQSGGSPEIRDDGLLESALNVPFQSFGDTDLYPSLLEKSARLGYGLIKNHPFVDGNKRIGMHIMLTFLLVNGIRLNCTNEDVVEAGLGVASGAMGYEELLQWIRTHREI